jgi:hypothetical protein
MSRKVGKVAASVAALAAIAVGSAAIADAATSTKSNNGSSSTPAPAAPGPGAYGRPPGRPGDGHGPGRGGFPGHKAETPLTGETADKVKAAAKAKVTGGTIERVESNTDGGAPYEAHVRKSDGTQVVVLVDKAFKVTAVRTCGPGGHGGPGGPPPGGRGGYGPPPAPGAQQGGYPAAPPAAGAPPA